MKHIVSDTVKAATGLWPQLLPALGISINIGGRHGACPVCGGKDRFRFDNQGGRGTWLCNQCGAGDGLNLVEKTLDVSAKEAAVRVAGLLGTPPSSAPAVTDDAAGRRRRTGAGAYRCRRQSHGQRLPFIKRAARYAGAHTC